MNMDDLIVLDATLYFESCDVVVLFVVLILESLAQFLDAIFDELGISAEC